MNPVDEKAILVTGASSGIGWCAVHSLKTKGYRVFAAARKREDVQRLANAGFEAVQIDLANSASIRAGVEAVLQATGGKLTALFNNAAYGQPGAVEDLSRDALRDQFEVNLFGTHELTRLIIPVMRAQGQGRIVQNSSLLGLVAMKYRGAYNASKFALEGLTDTLRMELADTGIAVILIEPGPILSRFRENSFTVFQQRIDATQSPHRDQYAAMVSRLRTEGPAVPFTLPPEAVVRKLIVALESPRPKARYYVTVPTYLFSFLKHVLPATWMDRLLSRF
jgi:NAD(P)-dependent dehydrogenase (short-subunit alcohol dehydrogenase family)